VDVVSSKEMVTALRLGLIFSSVLSSIDADDLQSVLAGAAKEAPSLLALGKQATSKEARRGIAAAVGLLNVFGAALSEQRSEKHR
jgi:hypothetical protein